jgi:hypothetical protein
VVLIGGTGLQVTDLPMSDMIEYIVAEGTNLEVKLKTVAKQPACKVYLHRDFDTNRLLDEVREKCIFFDNDGMLLKLLEGKEESESTDTLRVEESQESETFVLEDHKIEDTVTKGVAFDPNDIVEVEAELCEEFLIMPNVAEDIDSLKEVIEQKCKIIDQKDLIIKELKNDKEELYLLQEAQLREVRETYQGKLDEAIGELSRLQEQVDTHVVDDFTSDFSKFAVYSKNYSALLNEGLSEKEYDSLGKTNLSNVFVFTCGIGDSYFSMMKRVKGLIENNTKVVIADFSNSPYISTACKFTGNRLYATHLSKEDIPIKDIVKQVGKTKVLPSQCFNDIGLLGLDWGLVLSRLVDYAMGCPVIILFNSFNSFAVRYTVSKLATVVPLYIFAKCNPLILSSLSVDIKFIPENRSRIVATEYIDVVKPMIEKLSQSYKVYGFKDNMDWKVLGINY